MHICTLEKISIKICKRMKKKTNPALASRTNKSALYLLFTMPCFHECSMNSTSHKSTYVRLIRHSSCVAMSAAVSPQSDVVYERLMKINDTRQLTEPFLAIVHLAGRHNAARSNASLLAVQLLQELYEVSLRGYTCIAIRFLIKYYVQCML